MKSRPSSCTFCTGNKFCRICKPKRFCEHHVRKSNCKFCSGCPHGRRKSRCLECGGCGVCPHKRLRFQCVQCGGGSTCIHKKIRAFCVKCNGTVICKHKKRKTRCKICDGRELCKFEGCEVKGNQNYDNYCTHCFANLFPSDPRTLGIRKKSKELKVVTYFANHYSREFIHDKCLYVDMGFQGCCTSKRRIDLRKLVLNTLICVEIDENQHKSYDPEDEERRYNNLFCDFSGKYIFIRYNPDSYLDEASGRRKNPDFESRMKELFDKLDKLQQRVKNNENHDFLEIYEMYYDGYTSSS